MKIRPYIFLLLLTVVGFALTTCDDVTSTHDCARDGFSWGAWAETTPPTCTTAGVETRTCNRCGATETRTGRAALGHNWGGWIEITAPTSTTVGEEMRACARCGSTETRPIPQLDHNCTRDGFSWGDWVETIPPTCTTAGVETRTCNRCGTTETRTGRVALGHNWGDWVVTTPPTSTTPGVETKTCQHCGVITETRPIPPLEPGDGDFTIGFVPEITMDITGPVVSLAAGPQTITLLNPERFGSIEWFRGETQITGGAVSGSHGQSLALNSNVHNNRVGIHRITVEVSMASVLHSRVIVFTVTP